MRYVYVCVCVDSVCVFAETKFTNHVRVKLNGRSILEVHQKRSEKKMYSLVKIKNSEAEFIVKTEWIEGMDDACTKMYGIKTRKQRTIFYSPLTNATPNFSLDLRSSFCCTDVACYRGYVIKTFGKLFRAMTSTL